MKPTRGIFGGVCALAAGGQAVEAAVAPPKSAMNWRRCMSDPKLRKTASYRLNEYFDRG